MKGFTLFDFLVSSLIVAAIVTIAVFYEGYGYQVAKAETAMEELKELIVYAELESIKNNTSITLCPLDNHEKCRSGWDGNIAVFLDPNKQHLVAREDELLKSMKLDKSQQAEIRLNGFGSSNYLTLDTLSLSAAQNGTFVYCFPYGERLILRGLSISTAGRIRYLQQDDPYFKKIKSC
jgi:type IV fimbrial biogenesis protein FimT